MGLWDDFTDLVSDAASEVGALVVGASDPAGIASDLFGDGGGVFGDLGQMIENRGGMDEILGDISAVIPDDPFVDFGNPWGGVQDTIGALFDEHLPQDLGTLVADITGSGFLGGVVDPMSFVTDQLGLDGSLVNGAISWASDATGMDLDLGLSDFAGIAGSVIGTAGGEEGFGVDSAVNSGLDAVNEIMPGAGDSATLYLDGADPGAMLADAVGGDIPDAVYAVASTVGNVVGSDYTDALGTDLVDVAVTPSAGGPVPVPYPNTDATTDAASVVTVPDLEPIDDLLAPLANGPAGADVTAAAVPDFEPEPIPDAVDTAIAAADQAETSVDDLFEGL